MGKIAWDQNGSKKYEMGVDHGVLYQDIGTGFSNGVPWNGLTAVDTDDGEDLTTPMYAGDVKIDIFSGYNDVEGSISAYTYPDEFEPCLGGIEVVQGIYVKHQARSRFGLSYRSWIGNDTKGQEYGYKIHLLYNCEIPNPSVSRPTINDSPEPVEFSWDFECVPMVPEDDSYDPYAEIVIDSTKFSPESMVQLEEILYGSETEAPRLPTLDELIELFQVVDTTIPPEYVGYPYENLYPSTTVYPAAQQTP